MPDEVIKTNLNETSPVVTEFKIPTEYEGKEYLKDVKSNDDMFKQMDNMQQVLGKRPAGIPEDSADDETWNKYYDTVRPKELAGYEFNREGQSEQVKALQSDDLDNAVRQIFHEAGLSARQAKIVQGKYEGLIADKFKDKLAADAASDAEFGELANKTFGNDREAIMARAKKLLAENTPAGFEERVKGLGNEDLIIMAGVINSFAKKYIKEDGNLGEGGKAATGDTIKSLRAQATVLMAKPEWSDKMNTAHPTVDAEVKEIYAKITELLKSGSSE